MGVATVTSSSAWMPSCPSSPNPAPVGHTLLIYEYRVRCGTAHKGAFPQYLELP